MIVNDSFGIAVSSLHLLTMAAWWSKVARENWCHMVQAHLLLRLVMALSVGFSISLMTPKHFIQFAAKLVHFYVVVILGLYVLVFHIIRIHISGLRWICPASCGLLGRTQGVQ